MRAQKDGLVWGVGMWWHVAVEETRDRQCGSQTDSGVDRWRETLGVQQLGGDSSLRLLSV